MIEADQIRDLRTASRDYQKTEELKALFARARGSRSPMHLTQEEFERILRWKLRDQYHRQRALRMSNTPMLIESITAFALNLDHEDSEYELELRLGVLSSLRGVEVPVASAILALVYPSEYCVIDRLGWGEVFGEARTSFSTANYKRYLFEVRRLADELGWLVQEVDLAIWEYAMRQHH